MNSKNQNLKNNPLKSDYYIKVDPEELNKFSKSEKFWIILTLIVILIAILQGIIFYMEQNRI